MILVIPGFTRKQPSNYSQEPTHMDMKLSYTNIKTRTWKSNFSLKLAMEAKMEINVPLVSQGNIEMSGEFHSDVKWEETKESKTLVDVVHKIVVPAMTKVTCNLIATKGK
ncbi:flavin-dependent oxidoreductase FOX5-like [Gossypium australe]|uniref:Flavin-dependent oxidoreductase FOX5-like n=1 Tax=Gossypium australe TaxID=47621 RepID=A0A5B6WWX8_9ROSI|nr:flavin-dependent oxidoreductase FOX5-like [Gossypium australe]